MFHLLKQGRETKVPVIRTLNDLKPYKNWVCYSLYDGEIFSPVYRRRTTNEHPETWGTYEQADRFLKLYSPVLGLKFMLTPEFGITMVKVYGCIVNGELNEVGQEMVERYENSYIDIGLDGTGLRIWAQDLNPEHLPPAPELDEEGRPKERVKALMIIMTGKEWEVR